ncbi:MAG: hypothetical protein ACYDCK_15575 [Thermoplasmatota archaeon]
MEKPIRKRAERREDSAGERGLRNPDRTGIVGIAKGSRRASVEHDEDYLAD